MATCARVDRIARAAYVQHGMRSIATAVSLEELTAAIESSDLDADRFRVDVHDPARLSVELTGRSASEITLIVADVIPFGPDLEDPEHRFIVSVEPDAVRFGEVVSVADRSYRRHDDKPWTTSSSLDSRFARALINLAPDARSIVDPCCGSGSIVLEAASLGLVATGVDWKPAMAGMTTENIAHFGYSADIRRADSRAEVAHADAVVTDLPYGHAIESDERTIRTILERAVEAAPIGVYVANDDITPWLVEAGYLDVEVAAVAKRPGFTRHVHLASTVAPRS